MGNECGIDGCAIRLKDSRNLELHRSCHRSEDSNIFECPECSSPDFRTDLAEVSAFSSWPKLALHLWRVHMMDMELLSCPNCKGFRSYTRFHCKTLFVVVKVSPRVSAILQKELFENALLIEFFTILNVNADEDPRDS